MTLSMWSDTIPIGCDKSHDYSNTVSTVLATVTITDTVKQDDYYYNYCTTHTSYKGKYTLHIGPIPTYPRNLNKTLVEALYWKPVSD